MILQVFSNLNDSMNLCLLVPLVPGSGGGLWGLQFSVWLIFQSGIQVFMPKFKLKVEVWSKRDLIHSSFLRSSWIWEWSYNYRVFFPSCLFFKTHALTKIFIFSVITYSFTFWIQSHSKGLLWILLVLQSLGNKILNTLSSQDTVRRVTFQDIRASWQPFPHNSSVFKDWFPKQAK